MVNLKLKCFSFPRECTKLYLLYNLRHSILFLVLVLCWVGVFHTTMSTLFSKAFTKWWGWTTTTILLSNCLKYFSEMFLFHLTH